MWAGIGAYPAGGYADGYWYKRHSNGSAKYFDFITGSSNFRNGDWVMWARGSGSHPESHIAMYYNGKEFGENQGGNRQFRLINGHFGDALGAFRWKGWGTVQTSTPKQTTSKQTTKATATPKKTETKDVDPEDITVSTKNIEKETVQYRTDIKSVNAGKDYLESPEGIKLFGRISKAVVWDDVTVPANLKTKAQQALDEAVAMAITLEVQAVDASLLKFDVDHFRLGDYVEVVSPPHGLDTMLRLSKFSIPLDKPQDANYTFGAAFSAMTEQQVAQQREAYRVADTVRSMNVTVNEITPEKQAEENPQDTSNRSVEWIEV